jgi:cyclopropane fatty-acyl-phospholipid synthase-like methyltransferase
MKTESILKKYGPGPRVHFHTGIVDSETKPASSIEEIRAQLVRSQERLLQEAAHFWEAEKNLKRDVLDVGCGLGGSSIYFAQKYGANVHALTNVPGHIRLIEKFAEQTGLDHKIEPMLGDACSVPGEKIYDAVVAIESSCYLDRYAWFQHLDNRIRKGGRVFIADCFTVSDEIRKPFDAYWLTQIGALSEYVASSELANFKIEGLKDITSETANFWKLSMVYSRFILEASNISQRESDRLQRSIGWQTKLVNMWDSGMMQCALIRLKHL